MVDFHAYVSLPDCSHHIGDLQKTDDFNQQNTAHQQPPAMVNQIFQTFQASARHAFEMLQQSLQDQMSFAQEEVPANKTPRHLKKKGGWWRDWTWFL